MIDQVADNQAIMFADVAGSTVLYDTLGDAEAERRISQCLTTMTRIVKANQGQRVKYIGDEIMCRFPSADKAIRSACDIQLDAAKGDVGGMAGLQVRIGMHCGPVILKASDVFGDTVNVAARMAGLAQGTQIVCTSDVIEALSREAGIEARHIDTLYVKGKEQPIDVYQVIWRADDADLTRFLGGGLKPEAHTHWALELSCQGRHFIMDEQSSRIVIGRGKQCEFIVRSPIASRAHARLVSRRGKVVLTDQSTNGTYVQLQNSEEIYVHMNELLLAEDGVISLGGPVVQAPEYLIRFHYT